MGFPKELEEALDRFLARREPTFTDVMGQLTLQTARRGRKSGSMIQWDLAMMGDMMGLELPPELAELKQNTEPVQPEPIAAGTLKRFYLKRPQEDGQVRWIMFLAHDHLQVLTFAMESLLMTEPYVQDFEPEGEYNRQGTINLVSGETQWLG